MKVTDKMRNDIIRSFLKNPNQTLKTIAEKFGLHIRTIHNVLTDHFTYRGRSDQHQ